MTKGKPGASKPSSSKPSDVLSRMKAAAAREKPASTLPLPPAEAATPTALKIEGHGPVSAGFPTEHAPTPPSRVRPVRFTLDLNPEAHKRLKRFALEADADASEVLRALLSLLDTDAATRNAVLNTVGKDGP